ncbi:MAG: metal-dependent transcriptional regulator [Clostridia bacterium]|mgnify:CR=1 FL=1|nr:metal-dependent transcriptional regulator [Clostridia bacterium]
MIMGESAENYLETILILSKKKSAVRSVDIATELGYSKPSVCVAMRNLREHGYIVTDGDGSITLTESGLEIAKNVFNRHETITEWLMGIGVSSDQAAIDACRIEHVISQESFECLCKAVKNNKS